MRSASSTCAGRPVDMRPATYFTSGEYASTRRSRARVSEVSLYLRQRSLSSIALTLASTFAIPVPSLRARMRVRVRPFQPARLYPSVCLCCTDAGVSEQFLNCPQIGTSLEQMGGEGVPEGVRRYASRQGRAARP